MVRERLNAAFEEPRLRYAAAGGLFLAVAKPTGVVEQAVEMARSDDPRQATIGVCGLLCQPSARSVAALDQLLSDAAWSPRPPAQGPWARLEATRGIELVTEFVEEFQIDLILQRQAEVVDSPELRAVTQEIIGRLHQQSAAGGGFF